MLIGRKMNTELLRQSLLVFFVLVLIISISQMIRFLKMLSAGLITLPSLFKLLALVVPAALGYLIPPCMYLAVMMVVSRYFIDSEMVVLFSVGVSPLRILRLVMSFAAGVAVFVGVLMLVVMPHTEVIRKMGLDYAVKQTTLEKITAGRITSLGTHQTLYAQGQSPDRMHLNNVTVFIQPKDSGAAYNILHAKSMGQSLVRFDDKQKGQHSYLLFRQGRLDSASLQQGSWSTTHFGRLFYVLPDVVVDGKFWPKNLGFSALIKASETSRIAAGLLARKLCVILSVLFLAFLGFLFGHVKPRQGKFKNLLPALMLYGLYTYAVTFLQSQIVDGKWQLWPSLIYFHSILMLFCLSLGAFQYRSTWLPRLKKSKE